MCVGAPWGGRSSGRPIRYGSRGGGNGGGGAYAGTPAVSSSTEGSCGGGGITREVEPFRGRESEVLARRARVAGGSMAVLESEKGTTPARRAISCSPSCQCIASAARHGIAISSATLDHISALNLVLLAFDHAVWLHEP